jgi:two-component system chemotaxis response regulator CheB
MKKIRVLVVDDSSTMRGLIISNLSGCSDIELVGEAENPSSPAMPSSGSTPTF